MQDVSELYLEITSGQHRFECKVSIGGVDYGEDVLISAKTVRSMFAGASPSVGCCVAGEVNIEMLNPSGTIPRMAEIIPYIKAVNDTQQSEWIRKGDYYIDTRKASENGILTLHGYDAMLKTEVDFPIASINEYPTTDILAVQAIADRSAWIWMSEWPTLWSKATPSRCRTDTRPERSSDISARCMPAAGLSTTSANFS